MNGARTTQGRESAPGTRGARRVPLRGATALVLAFLAVGTCSADEFDTLRLKWRDMLTMGTNSNPADPLYTGWIGSIEFNAQRHWSTLNPSPARTNLWSDLNRLTTVSGDLTASYERLRSLALGFAVRGSSLENNPDLRAALISALDWLHAHHYNATKAEFDNWFDWEIGVPLTLNDITVLLYGSLTPAQISNYMGAVDFFTPVPDLTGANRVWKSSVVALRAAIVKDGAKLAAAQTGLSPVFPYATSGDGFYPDGSFVFHGVFSYNAGYGGDLLRTLSLQMEWLDGSAWAVTDPMRTNLFRWIHSACDPFLYRGAMMQMVDGRYYTRQGNDHTDGHNMMATILRVARFAPAADSAAYQSMVKGCITTDTFRDFIATQPPPYNVWASALVSGTNIAPRPEEPRHLQFPRMDRVVHVRPGWSFALAMSSSRVGNYESIRGENLRGWFTGDGMTYLYNADLGQYADQFWPTINPARLPGTTVDTQARADGSGSSYLSPNNWTGGASLSGLYGVAGMHLNAWSSTLSARKSWFMFDNEVVCLGAGISGTDGRTVETIVENRRLGVLGNNALTVNGTARTAGVGWSEAMAGISWAHLAGTVAGADVGYYFPQPTAVRGVREARSGAYSDLNTTYGTTNRATRNFLTLWMDHGTSPTGASYAYALLPNQSAAEIAAYAASPDFTVLTNSTRVQGVRENKLGLTAVNFWQDGTNRVGLITSDKRSSVIVRTDGHTLDFGLSDPTQTNNGVINVELSTAAALLFSADPAISVAQMTPTIRLSINVSNTFGRTLAARFFVGPGQTLTLAPEADAYVENGANTNTAFGSEVTLKVKAGGATQTREAFLRFDLAPAAGTILGASLRLVPITIEDVLFHALAPVAEGSWNEASVTWNNRPAAGAEFTRWLLPAAVRTPVNVSLTALAQQAGAGDGRLSLRIQSTGTPVPTNGGFAAYASRENGTVTNRPSLTLTVIRMPPTVTLSSPGAGAVLDTPASVSLVAGALDQDGVVSSVEIFDGATRVAQLFSAPYAITLPGLGVGQHSFTAVARDNAGLTATSAPVVVSVASPEPNGRGTGLMADFFSDANLSTFVLTRTDAVVNFFWGLTSPALQVPADRFSARWTGRVQARRSGTHLFHAVSDDGVRLWVDGKLIIDDWVSHLSREVAGSVVLTAGQYYDLRLEYYDNTGSAVVRLLWTEPGGEQEVVPQSQLYPAGTGLRATYFTATNLTSPVLTRVDDGVNFNWGGGSPDPLLLPGGFSARWTGRVRANQGGNYAFHTLSDDGVRLWINGQLLINNWTIHAPTENNGNLTLAAGQYYDLTMEYFDASGDAVAVLMWTPPGGSKEVVPSMNLTPNRHNSPPALGPLPDTLAVRGSVVMFAVSASDADLPYQALSFSLDPGVPAAAHIDVTNGVFTWVPPALQPFGPVRVTVRVTDNGVPVMSDAQTFTINVLSNRVGTRVTLVATGATWRYLDNGSNPGAAWRGGGFNDSAWRSGAGPLGYGRGDEATVLGFGANPASKFITTFFRREFIVPEAALVPRLDARLQRDDGAVVYLNGSEVWRDNMPTGVVLSTTLAASAVTGSQEAEFLTRALDPALLVNGTNVLAVEIHQEAPTTPDARFEAELSAAAWVPNGTALSFSASSGSVLLSWPAEAGLFQLFTTTNLAPPTLWSAVTNAPVFSNGQWRLALPAADGRTQFFRLHTP